MASRGHSMILILCIDELVDWVDRVDKGDRDDRVDKVDDDYPSLINLVNFINLINIHQLIKNFSASSLRIKSSLLQQIHSMIQIPPPWEF